VVCTGISGARHGEQSAPLPAFTKNWSYILIEQLQVPCFVIFRTAVLSQMLGGRLRTAAGRGGNPSYVVSDSRSGPRFTRVTCDCR
jgi:hypothetical protein